MIPNLPPMSSPPNTYTVTFDKQGGSGGSSSANATYDQPMPSAAAPSRTGFTFGGYYTGTNGGGTQYYTASMTSARNWNIADDTTLYAKWTPLGIGDPGPAGGIIFYDKGSYSGGWRYLEAATSDLIVGSTYQHEWGGYGTSVGGTSAAVGTGEANTQAIVNKLGAGSYAAKLCYDLTLGGYDDWFLPSKDELNLMYQQRGVIGGFSSNDYWWSSSEYGSFFARKQNFANGRQIYNNKNNDSCVRAVRAF